MRSRKTEHYETVKSEMNVHRRQEMMAFIAEWVLALSPNFPWCQGAHMSQDGLLRVSFHCPPRDYLVAGAPFDPAQGNLWIFLGKTTSNTAVRG